MTYEPEKRGWLIRHLEDALELADEIEDGQIGFLIERALDQARAVSLRQSNNERAKPKILTGRGTATLPLDWNG